MIDQVNTTDVLLGAVQEVFQTMIFLEVEVSPEPRAVIEGDAMLGSITFKGDIEGCLVVQCDRSCVRTIAASMLCLDSGDQIAEEELADALGEVTNMVMGRTKSRLAEAIPRIEMSVPTVVSGRGVRTSPGEGTIKTGVRIRIGRQHDAELFLLYRPKP